MRIDCRIFGVSATAPLGLVASIIDIDVHPVTLFCVDGFQRLGVEGLVGDELLQATVFVLQLLETMSFGHFHPAQLGAPGVKGRRADALISTDLANGAAFFDLFQGRDDLKRLFFTGPPDGFLPAISKIPW